MRTRLNRWAALLGLLLTELAAQAKCLVTGHDGVPEFGNREVFLRCGRCGRRTPGWQLAGAGPQLRFDGDPERHRLLPVMVFQAQFFAEGFERMPAVPVVYGIDRVAHVLKHGADLDVTAIDQTQVRPQVTWLVQDRRPIQH